MYYSLLHGLRYLAVMAMVFSLAGCYYVQAARGQLDIMRKRESIDDIVASAETPAELSARLRLVREARQFSIDELGLPDNDSYRSYADLERDFVVWNIVAVPEFSFEPKTWCYPIVGCVSYRGYFSERAAQKKARRLREKGYDVALGGVAAYSTLGRFSDPLLNTMMYWGDSDLVAVMFHELAHQVLYVKDDTAFNESFATAVEEFGMERWLKSRGHSEDLAAWQEKKALLSEFEARVTAVRRDLEILYAEAMSERRKRQLKAERLEVFADGARQLFEASGYLPPEWLESELNNARLVSTTLYHGRLPEFRALLAACNEELECFYREARKLADST